MMDRRTIVGGLASATVAPGIALGQALKPRGKIGYLHPSTLEAQTAVQMRPVWRKLGYVEGETILLRSAQEDPRRIPSLIDELVAWGAGALILIGPRVVSTAHRNPPPVPVVAVDLESDPVREGYIRSYASPGGNITGLFMDLPELAAKWLELIKECVPDLARVVILWDPATGLGQLEALSAAARPAGLAVEVGEVMHPSQSVGVLRGLAPFHRTGVVQLGTPAGAYPVEPLVQTLAELKAASIFHLKRYVAAGGLMSYGPKLEAYFPRAVDLAVMVLAGTPVGEIPVERPSRFDFTINARTAKALGLTIPQTILIRADEVLE